MRNIVWQTRERIVKGEKPPLKELIRTFWYMHIKPTLSRAGALANEVDQLEQVMVPLLGKSEDLLKIYELRILDKAIKDLIIHKVT